MLAMPIIQAECLEHGETLIHTHSPLMIYWAYKIYKSQGNTLYPEIIDLGENEKCSGMTLLDIYCVRKPSHLLLFLISLEQLQNFKRSNRLPII